MMITNAQLDEMLELVRGPLQEKVRELSNELKKIKRVAAAVEELACNETQVEVLSGNIVKESHWRGQAVAARSILMYLND